MIPTARYHSAHLPEERATPLDRFVLGGSIAFVADASLGRLPGEFEFCDVLYAEPPWLRGMDAFNQRAGADVQFSDLMRGVAAIVESATVPTFIVVGKQSVKKLPAPDQVTPVQLNQWAALLASYRAAPPAVGTTVEVTAALAGEYTRVGDFCCGYGRTLRAFHRKGKLFTGSDYNPRCIGYIAAHAPEWDA